MDSNLRCLAAVQLSIKNARTLPRDLTPGADWAFRGFRLCRNLVLCERACQIVSYVSLGQSGLSYC